MQIGNAHHQQLTALRQLLTDLKDASSGEFAAAFERQLERVETWTARIAAVGQVKAGKSSTLNALIGRVGFLPADVNPWTSVVTNMRLNIPGDPKGGARFEFFDEESWDRIINGDPRVREAAKKYLPGFDPEILRAQTEEMRDHAAKRLGPSYVKLLGTHHDYDLLSSELLESYVCAGAGSDHVSEGEAVGRYSSITKLANLFMQSDDYAVPTIITDTPGVNDPFLVRDEFTCQSLDQSDIFLVMLSAHQALTEVDIALIRMLAMQGEKEVIIYVNRIDELEECSSRVTRIVSDVSKRVAQAIPDSNFKIIFGSAHWAEAAMNTDLADVEIKRIIKRSGVEEFIAKHRQGSPTAPRDKLLVASGLPEIQQAFSEAIDHGAGARFVEGVASETQAQIAALKSVSLRQRHELQDRIEVYGSGRISEYKESLQDDMTRLAETHTSLAELMEIADEELDAIINASWVAMQQEMDAHTARFISAQRQTIKGMLNDGVDAKKAQVDLLPLRKALEDCLHTNYETTRTVLDAALARCLENSNQTATHAMGGLDAQISMSGLPGESVAVTFATSQKVLSFNLVSKRGFTFWKKKLSVDKTVDAFKRVASAEVRPATSKMVEAFMRTMTERALAGKNRLRLVSQIVEQSLNNRMDRLREDYQILGDDGDAAKEKILNRLHNDIEVIDNRLQLIGAQESVLTDTAAQAA